MQTIAVLFLSLLVAACSSPERSPGPIIQEPQHVLPRPKYEAPPPPPHNAAPLVFIDPGHGGKDDGACCLSPRYPEKRAALQLGHLLKQELANLGYRCGMTRSQDVFLPLHERAQLANGRGAACFVSIHFNHCNNPAVSGIEIFCHMHRPVQIRDLLSRNLAQAVLRHLVADTHCKNRGVKEANFVVLRQTKMPSILIEGGFLSNKQEGQQIADLRYIRLLAKSISQGIHHYFIDTPEAEYPAAKLAQPAGK